MRELAEVSRAETAPASWPVLSAETVAVVQARLGRAVPEMIEVIGHAISAYLDELAAACALDARQAQRGLLRTIVSDPAPPAELVAGLARAAGWPLPARVAVAVLGEGGQPEAPAAPALPPAAPALPPAAPALPPAAPALPPGVLADLAGPEPCLLLPDPDGPGRQAAIDRALRGWPAAIGPAVPLARAAQSLRWARHAQALARAGVIREGPGPVRCDQHLSTLLILADEDLAAALRGSRLAPLARLRPGQRDRIAETLLAWLQLGENAAEVAQRIHVHPQTVRYRLRQIQELFGDQLRDPDRRFELQLALRVRQLTAPGEPGRDTPPRSAP